MSFMGSEALTKKKKNPYNAINIKAWPEMEPDILDGENDMTWKPRHIVGLFWFRLTKTFMKLTRVLKSG